MTPFITPTKGPSWPKSVVRVISPEGVRSVMDAAAAQRPASASSASAQLLQRCA